MAITFPRNPKEIADRMRTDVKNALPESNPFNANSYLNADINATAGSIFEAYAQQESNTNNLFPDTAPAGFLERWGAIYGINRKGATQSQGFISVNGVAGSTIPSGTLLNTQTNQNYLTQEEKSIVLIGIPYTNVSFNPSTITFEAEQPHLLASGININVTGWNEAQANGTFEVNVVDDLTFSYEVPGLIVSPTGTPAVTSEFASIRVQSESFGSATNQISGATLSLGTTIVGVNNTAFVQADGLVGGDDIETDSSLRSRLLFRIRNPITPFSVAEITEAALDVSGVTRVFVQEGIGTVTVLFTQDNLVNNIPSGQVVEQVRQRILAIRPVGLPEDRVFVNAPTPRTVDLTFDFILPDTPTMRTAIEENVRDFFRNIADLGQNIKNRQLLCVIEDTIDLENGQFIEDFNLVQPGGDIPLNNDEIAVLGTVTYGL